jgi:hypothetical protein
MSGPRRDYLKVRVPPRDLSRARVIPRLPDCIDSARKGDAFPSDIIGATILRFGAAPPDCDLEGGGLIIDYVPEGQADAKRLALAFNELGMWVAR